LLRVGIVGCGRVARIHLERILALPDVQVAACMDIDPRAAEALAARAAQAQAQGGEAVPTFTDHRAMLNGTRPEAVAIFTPHPAHFRPAADALQAGCHVFVEKPLSTNVQEAHDLARLARSRERKLGVGHQYRLRPSLMEARMRVSSGSIGRLRLVTATLAAPWLAAHSTDADAWRNEPQRGGGILSDVGDHLLDALLWTTGQAAQAVAAFQDRPTSGLDLVTAATVRLADGTLALLGLSALSVGTVFEINYFGEDATLRATDQALHETRADGVARAIDLPPAEDTIDGNFVAAVRGERALCCSADDALDTVRLLDAIARSASSNQFAPVA
jgi:predicted dehydrogenase